MCAGVWWRPAEGPYFSPGGQMRSGNQEPLPKALFSTLADILVAEADMGEGDKGLERKV